MALEQGVFMSNHCLIPNAPLPGSHIPSLSLNFQTCLSYNTRLVCRGGPISCSRDHVNSINTKGGVVVHDKRYPRPIEIEWKKELCNSVQLIGVVSKPVQIRQVASGSGKVIAWSRLAVKKSQHQTGWIDLKFWDELAHIAFQHLVVGDRIYVSGRLVLDALEGADGTQQTYYKVTVQKMNFVGRNSTSPAALYDARHVEKVYEKRLHAMEAENGRMAAKHGELEAKVAMFEQMVREMNMNKMPQKPESDDHELDGSDDNDDYNL